MVSHTDSLMLTRRVLHPFSHRVAHQFLPNTLVDSPQLPVNKLVKQSASPSATSGILSFEGKDGEWGGGDVSFQDAPVSPLPLKATRAGGSVCESPRRSDLSENELRSRRLLKHIQFLFRAQLKETMKAGAEARGLGARGV